MAAKVRMPGTDDTPITGAIAKHDAHLIAREPAARGGHIVCLEESRSWVFALPVTGEVTIGREREATLRIEDPLASRAHAQLSVGRDIVRITDLKSRHGTTISGQPLVGVRALSSGDSICVGSAQLFVHRPSSAGSIRVCYGPAAIAHRLDEELERALRHGYEVAVLVVLGRTSVDHALAAEVARRVLRPLDVIAFLAERALAIVLPEADADEIAEIAGHLGNLLPGSQIGIACSPVDGVDADTLLGWARTAAAGEIAQARSAFAQLRVDARDVVVADPVMTGTYDLLRRLAARTWPLLICGEPGVGKETAARALHAQSPRAHLPFVALDAGSLTDEILTAELGRARAGSSTVFLDELADLAPALQAALAHALDGVTPVIASASRDLERLAPELQRRLVHRIALPPLRWRPRDLAVLVQTRSSAACTRLGRAPARFTIAAHYALLRHTWPGNIPELEAAMIHAVASTGELAVDIDVHHLPPSVTGDVATPPSSFRPIDDEVRDLERTRMLEALAATGGVRNKAAELIRMPLRTFVTKLKRYSITRDDW